MWEINRRTVSGFKTMFWRTAVFYVYIYIYINTNLLINSEFDCKFKKKKTTAHMV